MEGIEPLLIGVNIRKDEGGIRILADSIELLSEQLSSINYKIEIYLENSITSCDTFATRLFDTICKEDTIDQTSPISAEIKVFTPTDTGMNVEVSLPKKHLLTSKKIEALDNIIGIKKVYVN